MAKPKLLTFLFTGLCLQNFMKCSSISGNNADELWQFLFNNNSYNKNLRPVLNSTTQLKIKVLFSMVAIVDFNEIEETFTVTAFLKLSWLDEFLRWEPLIFGNLTHLSVPQEFIWKPFITLENSVVKVGELGTHSLQAAVEHTGVVTWKPVDVFKVSCPADVYKFPFDTQTCKLKFEPSGYSIEEVILTTSANTIDLREYKGTSGWTIASTKMEAVIKHSDSYAICSLTLERKPLYFLMNIFLPILLLSVMNMCVFILPVESGEKASFAVTVFLALAVFLTIVSGKLPENSDKISLINIYVFESTLLSTLTTIIAIVLIRIHNRDQNILVPSRLQLFVRMFPGHRHGRISATDVKMQDYDNSKASSENGNNNLVSSEPTKKTDDGTVTWPDVVKTFDKLFFVLFIVGYFMITVSVMGIAVSK